MRIEQMIIQQGEVRVEKIGELPAGLVPASVERDTVGRVILSHSEKGHHHVIDDPDVAQIWQQDSPPAGMRVIYAVVEKAATLVQTATHSHQAHALEPGVYAFRVQREYNPFLEQAQMVKD